MSVVTNILITCSTIEEQEDDAPFPPPVQAINDWLTSHDHLPLKDIGTHAGGEKHMEAEVYGGAFNYLDLAAFLVAVNAQSWEASQDARVFVQEEQEEHFSVYTLGGAGVKRIGE